jgi:KaiC/GvpD/RAD55 family RecA-like ATPase
VKRDREGRLRLGFAVLLPVRMARELLGPERPDHDLRFFVARAIRRHYHCVLSSSAADLFHRLAIAVNRLASGEAGADAPADRRRKPTSRADRNRRKFDYRRALLPYLTNSLEQPTATDADVARGVALFLECCRMVNYVQLDYDGRINLRAQHFDAEFLISRLFGMPTGIEGFDELFGGGLMLVDQPFDEDPRPPAAAQLSEISEVESGAQIRGRSVLALGRYATGKSLLALQVAVAVATKGGIAWIMPLEQSAEECLYALRSMCRLPTDGSVIVATDQLSATACLTAQQPGRGALIFLRAIKQSFTFFAETFQENVAAMSAYPCRLIVVDPINAIHRNDTDQHASRTNMLDMFEKAKASGTNVWLIAEEGLEAEDRSFFEQNITDTVIHLTLQEKYGDVQRYLEITKSRLQREQRGKHPYAIVPGRGITVYPSAAAVAERIASRRVRPPESPVAFGFDDLDAILGRHAIRAGDIVVLEGPAGTLKSQLGMMFLLHAPEHRDDEQAPWVRNLLIAARDEATAVHSVMQHDLLRAHAAAFRAHGEVRVRSLRSGFVHPGYILQCIEHEFHEARLDGGLPDRVLVDDVAHWETGCPYLREDETFGDTLVDLLRRYAVTTLLTCSRESGRPGSSLQQAIIDAADCVIQTDRIQFRGADRIVLRVLKTGGLAHRRETFEIELAPGGIRLKPTSSLLRLSGHGLVESVPVRLFLHAESDMQEEYNHRVLSTIRSSLSRGAEIESPRTISAGDALALATSSSNDEMQLLQLDEFQVPRLHTDGAPRLRTFAVSELGDSAHTDYFKRFAAPGRTGNFSVLPLYENVSLLAYRRDRIGDPQIARDWGRLAEACRRWEHDHDGDSLFFDFPKMSVENYNCLFLEILLSRSEPPQTNNTCHLQEWLSGPESIAAATLMRTLCRRAHLLQPHVRVDGVSPSRPIHMNGQAIVWRTWYSTLNQMMSELSVKDRLEIDVVPLPGNIGIAGEWYVGVPAHSAAPDVALSLMKFLTSREAELDRMKLGVGLPTRSSFYQSTHSGVRSRVSPYFTIDMDVLTGLVETAFARSRFDCYAHLSGILAAHLQTVIELADDDVAESDIPLIFESLGAKIGFMRNDLSCGRRGVCDGPGQPTVQIRSSPST